MWKMSRDFQPEMDLPEFHSSDMKPLKLSTSFPIFFDQIENVAIDNGAW